MVSRRGAVRGREGDVAEHGRTGRRHDIHGVGRRVAIGVEPDLAGRRQQARTPHIDAITAAGDRGRAIAVTRDRQAADRRTATRRDRRVEVDAGDAAAVDDDVTQGRHDRALRNHPDGTDHAVQAGGADEDVARRGERGSRAGTGEASRLATGHGGPRSRGRDAADKRGALQRDAAVRGRKGGAQSEGVVAGDAAGVGGDDHVAAERGADRSSDRQAARAGGGIGSERDGARRAERGGGGGVQSVTVRTRRGDRQGTRIHARASRDRCRQAHRIEPGAREGDVAVGAEDVTEEIPPHEGDAGAGEGDISRDGDVAGGGRGETITGTGRGAAREGRGDAADQGRALDGQITRGYGERVGEVHAGGVDGGGDAARPARQDDVAGHGGG